MDSDLSRAVGHGEGRKSDAEYQGGLCHAGAKNPRCRKSHFLTAGAGASTEFVLTLLNLATIIMGSIFKEERHGDSSGN